FLLPLAIALAAVAGILLFEAQFVSSRVQLGSGCFEILLHRGEAIPAFLVMVVKLPAHIRHLLANLRQLLLLVLDLRSALFEQGFAPLQFLQQFRALGIPGVGIRRLGLFEEILALPFEGVLLVLENDELLAKLLDSFLKSTLRFCEISTPLSHWHLGR